MMHTPVLLKKVIEELNPNPGQFFIDGTFGNGGHAREIIKRIKPDGTFLGIDWDASAIAKSKAQIANRENLILVNGNFKDIPEILKNKKLPKADGLLLDLGFSSEQIENSNCGFSFKIDEPLRMVYDVRMKAVSELLQNLKERELAEIIRKFSGEHYAERIACAIKKNLPIKTTGKLAKAVTAVLPKNYEHGRIHPATRTFLALRIFANKELENLEIVLSALPDIIKFEGRVAVISYHSLEDRIVKKFFNNFCRQNKAINLTKKPIAPTANEIKFNPRCRSAKLRVIQMK